jgi:hydroxymethylbilane synthase
LLAAAGLDRLGQQDVGTNIALDVMLPAPSQGAVGIETLSSNTAMMALLAGINDADTFDCVMAERAVLKGLGGTCHSPIAALGRLHGGGIRLAAEILSPDGRECVGDTVDIARGDVDAAEALGQSLLGRASAELRALFEA